MPHSLADAHLGDRPPGRPFRDGKRFFGESWTWASRGHDRVGGCPLPPAQTRARATVEPVEEFSDVGSLV